MSSKSKWLIKSDYKILGPYSFDQVEDLIMKKQISLIDEIRDMDNRWTFVREVPDFKNLVETIRQDLDKKGDMTQTLQTALQKTTTRAEATDPTMPNYTGVSLDSPPREDIPALVTSEIKKERKVSFSPTAPLVERGRPSKWIFIFAAIVVSCAVGWYAFNIINLNKEEKIILQQIRKYNLYSQDDKSIELFKKIPIESQDKVLVDIISLWPKLESAGVITSSRMLDLVTKGKVIGNERKSQYQLIKFNKAFNLGDIQNARDALVKAIDLDPSSLEVKESDALFSLAQKKYEDAIKDFKILYDSTGQGRFLYGYILSSINANTLNGSASFELVEKHLSSRVDFGKELSFLQLYIIKKFIPENIEMHDKYYNIFVQFPYQLKKYFKTSSLVNQDMYSWEYLSEVKKELAQGKEKSMIEIQMLIEKGEFDNAQQYLQTHQSSFNESEKFNLEVALNYFKKAALTLTPPSGSSLYLSTQLYLLLMQPQEGSQYVNNLMKEKPLFSNWAQLTVLKLPKDKDVIKGLINSDTVYGNEFLPYLELKAVIND